VVSAHAGSVAGAKAAHVISLGFCSELERNQFMGKLIRF
jgi:hypothetical protein